MKSVLFRWGVGALLCAGFSSIAFYSTQGDDSIPDVVLESVHLLKKSVEDLLPDLQENENLTADAIQQSTLDLDAYGDLHNSRDRWNEMRALIESGQPLESPLPSEVAISTTPVGRLAPAVPPPPGFTVQLPYESRLTVSGRKTIGMTYQSTSYANSAYATTQGIPTSQSAFELQQQLQVRINGQIGRKVTVNVDFDDTKDDKKDISIVYKGDPDELVQRAAFGDITLALPQTEFVGYNKQVFGASAELKYGPMHGYFIGSRTKGQTETKEFTGNVIVQRLNIPDISYVRHKYYTFNSLIGSANDKNVDINSVKLYLDTQDITRSSASLTNRKVDYTLIPGYTAVSSPTYNGYFITLAQGVDYTINTSSGIITLKNPLLANAVMAIDYNLPGTNTPLSASARGQAGLVKAIKWDESAIQTIPGTEDLTHYSIGSTQLVRDNGQGNFTLQLRDLNNTPVGQNYGVQYLPNNVGQIVVDFVQGTFYLTKRLDVFNKGFSPVYLTNPTTQSSFFVEYRALVKTYTLRPNIVLNSERITMNGRVLTRDVDYFIDYQSGFLTFFNPDQITETTTIQATYDFSPFGVAGAQEDTLVGTRAELSLYPLAPILGQSLVGATVLYDFAPTQTSAPDIRQTAGSFLVTEADVHLKDLIFDPIPFLKSSFTAEAARSQHNANTFGKALIDNMEGIEDATSVNLSQLSWQISSNPDGYVSYANSVGIQTLPGQPLQNLNNETVQTLAINPNASALPGDQTQVLDVAYDLTRSTEASLTTVVSASGLDFTKKLFLEMYIQGDGSQTTGTQLGVEMGQISEDADGTKGGNFSDIRATHPKGDGTPRTEDINYNGTLDVGEDVGWQYFDPDGSTTQIGAGNLRLDSEDLDRNGVLDVLQSGQEIIASGVGNSDHADPAGTQNFNFNGPTVPASVAASGPNALDFKGWQFVRVPLEISSATASSVKEIRLTFRAPTGSGTRGLVKFAKIAVVGNKWQPDNSGVFNSTVTARAINNEDDSTVYASPSGFSDFDTLNQVNTALTGPTPNKRHEQALAVDYNLVSQSSGTVTSVTVSPMDFSTYGSIHFFVHKNTNLPLGQNDNGILYFRAGSNTDYLEFNIPVRSLANGDATKGQGWMEVNINQSPTGKQRPTDWISDTPGGSTLRVGNPDLSSVAQLQFGVITATGTQPGAAGTAPAANTLWFDEIFAGDSLTRVGYAAKLASDFEIFGWGKFGLGVRDIDRNFETFTSALTNQDRHEETSYVDITRLPYFPINITQGKTRTDTPNVQQITNSSLVSVQQEGVVDDSHYAVNGSLNLPKLPKIGLLYDNDDINSHGLFKDDKITDYGLSLDYAVPVIKAYLPRTMHADYKITNEKLNFYDKVGALSTASDPFSVSNTKDVTTALNTKLQFEPVKGFTFNPELSRSVQTESKDAIYSTATVNGLPQLSTTTLNYDKLKSQTMGFDGVLGFRRWFSPRVRYNITNLETYGIPLAVDPDAADTKAVDRTSTGEMAWDFAWRDFSHQYRPLQSLNIVSNYLVEDGDTWSGVNAGKSTLFTYWIPTGIGSGSRDDETIRDTFRSTARWSPFDWATYWTGSMLPLRTLSVTNTFTDTRQRTEATGTSTRINTQIIPDMILSLTQTEYFFHLQKWMSNSQMNLKSQYKTVDTVGTSLEKASTNGGDWRFTLIKKLDLFVTYTQTTDTIFDRINNVMASDSDGSTLGVQMGFNVGKWRFTPKYDQTKQKTVDSSGNPTTDLTTRTPALQIYADLFLPAGLKLPFSDLVVFSNRIRTTNTISLTQKRSALDALDNDTDSYTLSTSEDYEMTSNIRLTVGGSYSYTVNKVSADANFSAYQLNTLLTIQF